ncbi:MAG: hypothetical protein OEW04_02790 [Nitrospirota bacterium]|nr:hypothetical protein [Nitrospirota bacterium]
MAIISGLSLPHWNYFLSLEKDLEVLSRYVEFSNANFPCYSLEIARILFSAASEVDVVSKQLCKKLNANSSASNIHHYRKEIKKAYSELPSFKVTMPRFGLELTPWLNWNETKGVPDWWTAYNKVKHHRDTDFHKGNLKNCLNAVAGLFIIVLFFYKEKAEEAELLPVPSLLRVTDEHCDGFTLENNELGIHYKL